MTRRQFVAGLTGAATTAALTRPSWAQLVAGDRTYKVIKVDQARNRLEVAALGDDRTSSYVLVNGHTQVTRQGQTVLWAAIPEAPS